MLPHKQIRLKIGALIGLTVSIIVIGTLFYHYFEHFDYIDAFYFSVITLTTVGYGDLHPVTETGKLFTILYIVVGIGILMAFIDTLSQRMVKNKIERIEQRDQKRSGSNTTTATKEAKIAAYRAEISTLKADIDKEHQK